MHGVDGQTSFHPYILASQYSSTMVLPAADSTPPSTNGNSSYSPFYAVGGVPTANDSYEFKQYVVRLSVFQQTITNN